MKIIKKNRKHNFKKNVMEGYFVITTPMEGVHVYAREMVPAHNARYITWNPNLI